MNINRKGKYVLHFDKFVNLSVDKERTENWKRRVKSTEGLFNDEDGNLNAQNKRIKIGT